jgi:hypothetical protein
MVVVVAVEDVVERSASLPGAALRSEVLQPPITRTTAISAMAERKRMRRLSAKRSGPYRDRTCDLEIKSLLLYQLS